MLLKCSASIMILQDVTLKKQREFGEVQDLNSWQSLICHIFRFVQTSFNIKYDNDFYRCLDKRFWNPLNKSEAARSNKLSSFIFRSKKVYVILNHGDFSLSLRPSWRTSLLALRVQRNVLKSYCHVPRIFWSQLLQLLGLRGCQQLKHVIPRLRSFGVFEFSYPFLILLF